MAWQCGRMEAVQCRVCFADRLRVTTWSQTRQTDLDALRSSIHTRSLARRPSLHRAARPIRQFRLDPIRAAARESVGQLARALDPIPTARRGPHAAQTTQDPTNPHTAPQPQADCLTVPHTVTSLIACSSPHLPGGYSTRLTTHGSSKCTVITHSKPYTNGLFLKILTLSRDKLKIKIKIKKTYRFRNSHI